MTVRLHGSPVGRIVEGEGGRGSFEFFAGYLDDPERAILGQHFEDAPSRPFRAPRHASLPNFFANLLPEGRLREFLLEHYGLARKDDFALLGRLGHDLPGAVTVSHDVVEGVEQSSGGGAVDEENDYRFASLSGVQLKFSALFQGEKLTLPQRDSTGIPVIAKFHGEGLPGLVENEHTMMSWAREAGFDVPDMQVLTAEALESFPFRDMIDENPVYIVNRYDRSADGSVHQEDFAQVRSLAPPRNKYDHIVYEDIGILVHALDAGFHDFMRRIVFMLASGNDDAHAKNWSLIYPDRRRPKLAPLYDQVFTGPYMSPEQIVGGNLRRSGKRPAVTMALKLASMSYFGQADERCLEEAVRRVGRKLPMKSGGSWATDALAEARSAAENLLRVWNDKHEMWPMYADHKRQLAAHWQKVPFLRRFGNLNTER